MRPSYSLAELLPHRPPMVLIDEIVDAEVSAGKLTAAVVVKPEWSGNWVAIEFMAQTAAALAGLADLELRGRKSTRPGFLLGTRKMELGVPRFEVGQRYLIHCVNEFEDDESASFSCSITNENGDEVASAILNAYRPADIQQFLRERGE